MILLKILLALVGLAVIAGAVFGVLTGLTQALGFLSGLAGTAVIILIFHHTPVLDVLGVSVALIDHIALGALVGGGILCAMELERLGAAMITAGWVAVGLILLQVVPIPFISNLISLASLPFTVACIPLFLLLLLFVG